MLTKVVRYGVTLHDLRNNFGRKRNIVIHHGLMGSCKNFRTISKSKAFSDYFNSYMIDARNHGDSPHTASHTISELADDLYEYISTNGLLDPNCRLTLMGHSMGGMALMEFTKRYYEMEIQSLIDRVIIIDIPAVSINEIDPINSTGTMLKKMSKIDLTMSLQDIYAEIDKKAIRKDIAGLLKGDIIKSEKGGFKWRPNIDLLAFKAYENISSFALTDNNPKEWKGPVELIFGEFSGMFDEKQKKEYCKYYPQMKEQNFHQIDKSGHWVHFQNTHHFLETCRKIFERDQPKQ